MSAFQQCFRVCRRPLRNTGYRQFQRTNDRKFSVDGERQSAKKKTTTLSATQVGMVILGGALSARLAYSKFLLDPEDYNSMKHGEIRRDSSNATVLLNTAGIQKKDASKLALEDIDESTRVRSVDATGFSMFCKEQKKILRTAREHSQKVAQETFRKELDDAFSDVYGRTDTFASWYFAYPTTWKLLSVALTSAAKHAVTFRSEQTLSQKVSEDLQTLVCRKYEALVLRPALTDPKIHRAFVRSIRSAHKDYLKSLEDLEGSVASFVAKETTAYSSPPRPGDVIVDVDWRTQLQKVDHLPLTFEKTPEFSVAVVGASVVAGKVIGGGAAASATKAMLGKVVSPFVAKAVGVTLGGGAAAAGAAGGAMAGGPMGAAIGAAIGLTVDMTVNAGVALMQRSSFEQDVKDSLDATILEWEENLFPELERIHGIWFDHAESVLDMNVDDKHKEE
jgi:hypothetical protein